ncbi:MAG: YbdK family carboxylate-amine ligase [Burkholderiaceae bacterium]|jgi:carboxylate-amine ligase|nr:YbdK family carboxylate-amine ligase [Burkholderiaceae bacterium]
MPLPPFAHSDAFTIGVELELQVVGTYEYDLANGATDLLREVNTKGLVGEIKPEITGGMIELSTGVCGDCVVAVEQLTDLRDRLLAAAARLDLGLCGGGTHPFQHWHERRIVDAPRFRQLTDLYGYLMKQFTVFGQHVHIGCPDADSALRLLHSLGRYIPHFIALSACSPYVQGADTGFQSARLNSVFAFPLSGRAPFVLSWREFEAYFEKMTRTGVVAGMKDFYWDIRPKPEFGTIELRVMDTPLTIHKAAALAGYLQALARYLTIEKPFEPREDDYLVYTFNRFQASRFGLHGLIVDPQSGEQRPLRDDLIATLARVEPHATDCRADAACAALMRFVTGGESDADWLRAQFARERSLADVVRLQCERWEAKDTAL